MPWLIAALLLTLGATAWVSEPGAGAVAREVERAVPSVEVGVSAAGSARSFPELSLPPQRRGGDAKIGVDPFTAKSWYEALPPPVAAPVVEPPKPSAPPLPFAFMGRVERSGEAHVYFVKGDQLFTAKVGETFDAVYQLQAIESDRLEIVHLPSATKQYLSTLRD